MSNQLDRSDLRGRKKVRLRKRPNLQINSRVDGGRKIWFVKDPISLNYYHLEEPQYFALKIMDGRRTLQEIQQAFEKQYKPQRLSLEELESFAGRLLQSSLVEIESASLGHRLYKRAEKQKHSQKWAKVVNIFYIKFPLFNPDKLLTKFQIVGRTLFHPLSVVGFLFLLLAALGLIITRWDEFLDRLPAYHSLFTWKSMLYLWIALGIVKVLHELGHGFCSKTVGGEVNEMGAVLLFFFPTLYCNVSDCWLLPSKWKRIAVSAAGIYVELIVATISIFIWWATDPDTLLHNLSFALILVCSIHTLVFNANPLMRFDGYFILSDWIEIPNLGQMSNERLVYAVKRWFGMNASPPSNSYSPWFLFLFGLACLVYRCLVIGGVFYIFHLFMKEQGLEWLGTLCISLLLMSLVALPILRLAKSIKRLGRFPEMKRSRLVFTLSLVMGGILGATFIPFPMTVRGHALIQVIPEKQYRLIAPAPGGFLDQLFIRDGSFVQEGDILAVLRNPNLEREIQLNEAEQKLRVQQKQAVVVQLASLSHVGVRQESFKETEHHLQILAQQHSHLKARNDALVLRAPCSGVVMGLANWEFKGKWLKEGTQLCNIGNTNALRSVLLLQPSDRRLVKEGKRAWFLPGGGCKVWKGKVTGTSEVDANAIPPQLSTRVGGEVASKQDPVSKQERPENQHYMVTVDLEEVDHRLQVGALGQVRIDAGNATIWWRCRRWLGTTFNWGL